jgi:6-phosphogluconolactonase
MEMKPEVQHYPSLETLSRAAAEFTWRLAEENVQKHGAFTLVLSGGNTPRTLYETLARPPFDTRMPWDNTHLFWGDERCVSSDHPDSNFAMAFRTLISRIPIPSQNVHRIPADIDPPENAAKAYEKLLRAFFKTSVKTETHSNASCRAEPFPSFDLILLGVGKDGHTASLFPGDQALEEEKHWVAAVRATHGSPPVPRITLTLPVINKAECVLFMVSGSGKREVIRSILEDLDPAPRSYPAARVSPEGMVVWLIDEEAA